MRLPRVRFTVQGLMVAVAVAALACALLPLSLTYLSHWVSFRYLNVVDGAPIGSAVGVTRAVGNRIVLDDGRAIRMQHAMSESTLAMIGEAGDRVWLKAHDDGEVWVSCRERRMICGTGMDAPIVIRLVPVNVSRYSLELAGIGSFEPVKPEL